jgi:UDP-4-amino-4,6-dideoxy-N-acetyl-beta-L-altrosamine transaminase
VSFIPYSCQNISDDDVAAVCDVLRSDYLTQGPVVPQFEEQFAARHAVAHAVAVCNATAGLHIGALALGVGPGTRVWTSPNSFVASANCALYCGAQIDFVDIDPGTRQMSVAALAHKLAAAQRSGTLPHVVIPVDFAGLPCELREIRELADRYGFKILQDASHATGASYLDAPVGSRYAHASVFSFHAVKIVTTAEGGLVTTQDAGIADKLRLLRTHGVSRDAAHLEHEPEGPWYYEQSVLGFNYRMTELQAALGLSQLARLPQMQAERSRLAERYDELLADLPLILPARGADRESAWHLYVVEIDEARTSVSRATVFNRLRSAGIGVNVHYIPIHTQPFYARLGFRRGDFPASESYYARAMSIPLFPALTAQQQSTVARALTEALA